MRLKHPALLIFFIFIPAFTSPLYAITMSDYFPLNRGNIKVFDRNVFAVGPESHRFAHYTGQAFIDAVEFHDMILYFYSGADGILLVGAYDTEPENYIDLSSTPVKIASGLMDIGESVISTIPAEVVEDWDINFTSTLTGVETVVTPAGTFHDTLKLNIVISSGDGGTFREIIWLAKGIGVVKTRRPSETPTNYDGCLFTCGAFDYWNEPVQQRDMNLLNYVIQETQSGDISHIYNLLLPD